MVWKNIAGWSIAIIGVVASLLILTWLQPISSSKSLQYMVQTEVSLTAWIYSKPVGELLAEYQSKHPEVNIEIRTFRSERQLYEELMAAISTRMPPNMAEIGSGFGIIGLAETGGLAPFDRLSSEPMLAIDSDYLETFKYDGQLWAMPYGMVVPVLYYNENLMRLSDAPSDATSLSWEQLTSFGMKMTQDINGDGSTDIWGLVADNSALWNQIRTIGVREIDSATDVEYLFSVWHDLVHRYKIMPALEQHLALSSFIDGTAGMLLAPSDIAKMLEEYIGGTFEFGVLPVPHIAHNDATPARVSGFVMLRSGAETEQNVRQIISYLLQPEIQQRLFKETSKLPILKGSIEQLVGEGKGLTERDYELFRIAGGKLQLERAGMTSKAGREKLLNIQLQLEANSEACIPCMMQAYEETFMRGMR
ncbi:extracellular solute-binding protein [Paenibacillus sp. GCM10012307]|uniref:Extracellular solute-binding protein n=1 Tax=Paenibacillus roseus TaxID=2798579 RepID=A0A934JCK2_9BACL|nr:extracellular solute-binding protein [Paenibacillus roseus]MBJ6364325.1 extracellular solute-binding protein [Paenibacillus roseus]